MLKEIHWKHPTALLGLMRTLFSTYEYALTLSFAFAGVCSHTHTHTREFLSKFKTWIQPLINRNSHTHTHTFYYFFSFACFRCRRRSLIHPARATVHERHAKLSFLCSSRWGSRHIVCFTWQLTASSGADDERAIARSSNCRCLKAVNLERSRNSYLSVITDNLANSWNANLARGKKGKATWMCRKGNLHFCSPVFTVGWRSIICV